ncbi:MAG: redoxin domain-containing protein, partial [Chitinophagaceae bacterium]
MKKLLLFAALAFGLSTQAQLAPGSQAPDFTVTDLNGNTHTLSEYLAQGKSVILDISAAWCGPCWAYHNTHALEDVYETYGMDGSEEVVVLFVEGDGGTAVEMLYGTGVDGIGRPSQGNWVANTPYPIVDSPLIADLYEIAYFPTVYRICPDGTTTEIGSQGAAAIKNGINSNCGITLQGQQNFPRSSATEFRSCTDNGALQTKIRNMGSNPMTSLTVVLKENGNVIETKNWTGTTNQFSTANINFSSMTVNSESSYVAEVTSINGVSPLFQDQAMANIDVNLAQVAQNNDLTVKIYTDLYALEIKWRIKNSAGTVVASGGPYTEDENNSTITETFSIPANVDQCYRFEMQDTYGDGWGLGEGQHGVQVLDNGVVIFEKFTNESFDVLPILGAFKTMAPLSVGELDNNSFAIYPNPSNGIFNVRTTSVAAITVSDLTGKTVYQGADINDGATLNLTSLQTGMYIA